MNLPTGTFQTFRPQISEHISSENHSIPVSVDYKKCIKYWSVWNSFVDSMWNRLYHWYVKLPEIKW